MKAKNVTYYNIPKEIIKPIKRWNLFLILFSLFQLFGWYCALFQIGSDTDQGNIYRIIFVHVPVAWCAFFWIFLSAIFAILTLIIPKKAEIFDRSSHTAIEVGTIFSLLTLITGSIWGKATWGIWWDWDPRLTSSFVMFLVSCGYLILRYFTPDLKARRNVSAIVAIIGSVNVPIVYFSVNLWRSVHQPQTFVEKTNNASTDISMLLLFNYLTMFILSIVIYKIRRQSIAAKEILDIARGEQ